MKTIALIPYDQDGLKDKIISFPGNTLTYLKKYLNKHGFRIHTIDKYENPSQIDGIISMDISKLFKYYWNLLLRLEKSKQLKRILIILEPPIIRQDNWNIHNHYWFDAVLTWNDSLVDNKKYFKYLYIQNNYSDFKKRNNVSELLKNKNKLFTLISANKFSFHPDELYSERRRAIDFFEKAIPDSFDLYGRGWNRRPYLTEIHPIQFISGLNFIKSIKLFLQKQPIIYKGEIENKHKILLKYKFCICFENMTNIKGYISEKIWDCFRALTVPVYLGADNIEDFIPKSCFIDMREFYSYGELLDFIMKMSPERYSKYIKSITNFSNSEKARNWFGEKWAYNVGSLLIKIIK